MDLIKQLISIDNKSGTAIYLQVSNAFILHIRQGRLRKGLKLPGSRELAALLKINRMTAVAAYQELDAQGWIETLPRKGTFVKVNLPLLTPQKMTALVTEYKLPGIPGYSFDESGIIPGNYQDMPAVGKLVFNDGFPDIRIAPVETLFKTMRSLSALSSGRKYLAYGGAQGTLSLRETLASFLADTRGLVISPENLLITRGAQMGIYLAGSLVLKPGDLVIAGRPGYNTANLGFKQLGAQLVTVPVDDNGIDTTAVENICKKKKIKMLYVIPHHHNPTTVTLSPERRMHLLSLSARYHFAILEDDYDYDFHYASKPIMPMASHDRQGNVIYIGTLTKTLAPAIRVGFMVAPAKFIQAATGKRKLIDTQGDSLMENALALLYKDGSIARHIKKSVSLYRERRDHFCTLLGQELGNRVSFKIPDGGMSVWTRFLKNDLKTISSKALAKGLVIRDGTDYDTEKLKYNSVRLGFASLNTREQEKAVSILKDLCR